MKCYVDLLLAVHLSSYIQSKLFFACLFEFDAAVAVATIESFFSYISQFRKSVFFSLYCCQRKVRTTDLFMYINKFIHFNLV